MSRRKRSSRGAPSKPSDDELRRKERLKALTAQMKANAQAKTAKTAPGDERIESPKDSFNPQDITFLRSGNLEAARLTTGTTNAVRAFRDSIKRRSSAVILNWPNSLLGVSALHSLAFLCELAEGPETFRGFTTVFYPASARTGANQRALLVERDWLISANSAWLNAYYPNLSGSSPGPDRTQARFHNMLARTNDLRPEALSNFPRAKAVVSRSGDRGHPTLFELTARRRVDSAGKIANPEESFLTRSRRLSELLTSKHSAADYQRVEAVEPETTPWLLSTIHGASPTVSWGTCTLPSKRKPDIILVDLQYRARARLGENWRREISGAISRIRHGDHEQPLFLVTDDPFIALFLKFEFCPKPQGRQKRRPLPVNFLRQETSTLLSSSEKKENRNELKNADLTLSVEIFASDLAAFVSAAMQTRRDTASLAGGAIAQSIGVCLSRMRMIANSPMSQTGVNEALYEPDEPHLSNRLLQAFDIGGALADLTSLAPQAGAFEADVLELAKSAQALATSFSSNADATTSQLLRTRLKALPKRGTRTLVATSGASATQLLERWIETAVDLSDVADRLGEKFDIVPARDAIAKIELAAASSKPFGHLLLLSTQPRDTLAVLSHPACPSRIELVSDASSAKFTADYGTALLQSWPDQEPGRSRILKTVEAIRSNLASDIADLPEFALGEPANSESQILDLTSQSSGLNSPTLEITTVDGDTIHANLQTNFVTRRQADLERFENVRAENIVPGREILVPGLVFLEAVQASNEFRAAAAPLLADYHNAIRHRIIEADGGLRAKAQQVLSQMDCDPVPLPTLQSVCRWLNVVSQDDVPIELRTPQAPRSFTHFTAFCTALNIDNTLAEIYWTLAITATRGGRIRSGLQLRKLYAAALIDPDALIRSNKAAEPLIDKIRDLSAEHVSEVLRIERVKQENT